MLNQLYLILVLVVTAWSLYNGISYFLRRGGDKRALKEIGRDAPVLRVMTPEEMELVQPFLRYPPMPSRVLKLKGSAVYALRGAFARHGLVMQGGRETFHDTVGGVEVVLPYDARRFLDNENEAEVVLTNRCAVVIKLNGVFDLAGGCKREQEREHQDAQWQSGQIGELDGVTVAQSSSGEADVDAAANADADAAAFRRVDLLGQRQETPAEIAARQLPKLGVLAVMAWLGAFAFAWWASKSQTTLLAIPAALCAGMALWLTWRKPAHGEAQQVNHAHGELTCIEVRGERKTVIAYFLGDKMLVTLPEHWRKNNVLGNPELGPLDLDVRVSDHAVLRIGNAYSIDAETRSHPYVPWIHHAVLAVFGLLMLCVAPAWIPNIRLDALAVLSWAHDAPPRAYDSASALAADPPAIGREVIVSGAAHCALVPQSIRIQEARQEVKTIPFAKMDCTQLQWGGQAPQRDTITMPQFIQSLANGDFLQTEIVSMPGYARYAAYQPTTTTRRQLSEAIMTVDLACASTPTAARESCDRLKTRLLDFLNSTADKPVAQDWAGALSLAQNGKLNDDSKRITVNQSALHDTVMAASQAANVTALALVEQAAQKVMNDPRGGIWLNIRPDPQTSLTINPPIAGQAAPVSASNVLDAWNALTRDATQERPFHARGLITSKEQGANGALTLTIVDGNSSSNAAPAIIRCLALIAAIALTLAHGGLWFIRRRAAIQRRKILEEEAEVSAKKLAFSHA